MKQIIEYLPILKAATTKDNYPMYCQLVNIGEKTVRTCNSLAYVEINLDIGIKGKTNIFVLESLLKILPDESKIEKADDKIIVTTPKTSYTLNLVDIDIPTFDEPDIDYLEVDEGLLAILQLARKFLGVDEYEHVYVDKSGFIATNGQKLLYYAFDTKLDRPLMLTRNIINMLEVGYKIGANENENAIVKFPFGFAIFTVQHHSLYPVDKIREFHEGLVSERNDLIQMSDFRAMLQKVSPVFIGESFKVVELTNNEKKLVMKAESPYNGKASVEEDSVLEGDFNLEIDSTLLSCVPSECILQVKLDQKFLMASDGHYDIILRGAK